MKDKQRVARLRSAAGGAVCALTVPLVLGGAPALASAADAGGTGVPVALVGTVDGDVSLENAQFSIQAQPAPEIDDAVEVGEAVPLRTLPAELVKAEGNEFSLGVRPDDLGEDFISSDGLVTVEVEIYVPEEHAISTTMASFQLIGEDSAAKAQWAAADGEANTATVKDAEPVRVEMELHPLPESPGGDLPQAFAAGVSGEVGAQTTTLIKKRKRLATIGTTYPIAGQKATMFHGSGRSITYGAAVNYGGNWGASGSKSISNGYEFEWAPKKIMRSYRVQVRYGLYLTRNRDGIELYRKWRPIVETGITKEKKLSKRPTWNKGAGVTDRCDNLSRGAWYRTNSSGKSYSLSTGVKFRDIIGIDLSTNREYSSSSKLTYNLSQATRRLCGNNEAPGLAGKIAQYRS